MNFKYQISIRAKRCPGCTFYKRFACQAVMNDGMGQQILTCRHILLRIRRFIDKIVAAPLVKINLQKYLYLNYKKCVNHKHIDLESPPLVFSLNSFREHGAFAVKIF